MNTAENVLTTLMAVTVAFFCSVCPWASAAEERPLAYPCGEPQSIVHNGERIVVQVYGVSITQTCKHSTGKNDSGETVWITPGLLLINGKLRSSAPLSGDDQFEAVLTNDSETFGCLVTREQDTKSDYAFVSSLHAPPGGFSLRISGLGDISIDPLGANKQGLETTIVGEPTIKHQFLTMGSEPWDAVEFVLIVKNSGACTWTFDAVEVVQAVDAENNRLAEVSYKDPAAECPAVTLLPGEEKSVTLLFSAKDVATVPGLQCGSPLVLIEDEPEVPVPLTTPHIFGQEIMGIRPLPTPVYDTPQSGREDTGKSTPASEWKSIKKMKSSVANARAIIAACEEFVQAFPDDKRAKDARAKIDSLIDTLLKTPGTIRAEGIAFANGVAMNLGGASIMNGTVDLRNAIEGLMAPQQKGAPPSADEMARRSQSFGRVLPGATLSEVVDIVGLADDLFEQVGPNTPYERVYFWRLSGQVTAVGWFDAEDRLTFIYPSGAAGSGPEVRPPAIESTTVHAPVQADSPPVSPDASLTTALVDRKAVLKGSAKVAEGYAELNKWLEDRQGAIDALSARINKAKADYEKSKPRLSVAECAAEEYRIENLYAEYQEKLKTDQATVDSREAAFMNGVNAEIDALAEEIRAARGYAAVKDRAAFTEDTLPSNSIDITQEVLDALNGKKSVSGTLPAGEAAPPSDPRLAQRVHVRHILVAVADTDSAETKNAKRLKAADIQRQLLDGADFAETARKFSDCPTREQGGDVGVMTIDMMLKPLQEAALTQKTGEIGPAVESQYGYHIIQLLEDNAQAASQPGGQRTTDEPLLSEYRIPEIRAVGSTISKTDVILEGTDKPNVFIISTRDAGGQTELLMPDFDPNTLAQGMGAKKKKGNGNRSERIQLEDMTWYEGARHTLKGTLTIQRYTFVSDATEPLVFRVTSQGYTYEQGRGTVTTPEKAKVVLGSNQ